MRDIDIDIRDSLERLTDPHSDTPGTDALWGDLVTRRRRRRNRSRALAALPLLLVGVLAAAILSAQGSGDARSDVAAGDNERSEGPEDFAPFEMTFRTLSYQGGEMAASTWKLTYESWTDWETTLIDGGPGVAEEPGFRRVLSDGTLTEYSPDGRVRFEERLDGRLAPLALMGKGPRTGKAGDGDSDSTYQHEYTSSQEHECPEDPAEGAPYCEQPGEAVVVETVERYNSDGVPVFAEERIAHSGRVVWQFEMLTYDRYPRAPELGSPSVSATTEETAGATSAGGVPVGETFPTGPIGGEGHIHCVNGQRIRVYEFSTSAERESAAESLHPDDASRVDDASVAWVGNPIFWRSGDRELVMYAGREASVIDHLDDTLGTRVSQGRGRSSPSDAFAC